MTAHFDAKHRKTLPRVAYLMSRFPKITETFVLYEICALAGKGWSVDIYPLLRHHDAVTHPEIEALLPAVHYLPFISLKICRDNLLVFFSRPLRYVKTVFEVFKNTMGSLNFFVGALGIFPKTVCFAREMEKNGIEHIHAHFANHPALAALIIHRLTEIPFSFTAHGSDIHVDQTMFAQKAQAARFVVTISEYNRRFLAEKCGKAAVTNLDVIHCGLDMNDFQPCGHHRQEGPFKILCVAAFREVKGHRYLLEACRLLRERGIDFECTLIGSYELEDSIRQFVRELRLQDHVKMAGPQPRPQVKKFMCRADVVALTSIRTNKGHREGIPMVLAEAMACAKPVVASRISGIPELVADGISGLLTTPGAPDEIADALQKLAENPALRQRMGLAGREKVEQEFNQRDSIEKLSKLFKASAVEYTQLNLLRTHQAEVQKI